MSTVGIAAIILGIMIFIGRGALVIGPATTLNWFRKLLAKDLTVRLLGVGLVPLGAAMVWAGGTESTGLANIIVIFGWLIIAISAPLLVLFPAGYRFLADLFMPDDVDGDLAGWRILGILGAAVGLAFIFAGASAL